MGFLYELVLNIETMAKKYFHLTVISCTFFVKRKNSFFKNCLEGETQEDLGKRKGAFLAPFLVWISWQAQGVFPTPSQSRPNVWRISFGTQHRIPAGW